jgi:3-oxoacyl-[acyl-carrier protein] reductase
VIAAARSGGSRESVAQASVATIPTGRYGKPQELADIVFLASKRVGYVAGAKIRVDGSLIRGI